MTKDKGEVDESSEPRQGEASAGESFERFRRFTAKVLAVPKEEIGKRTGPNQRSRKARAD